MINEIGRKSCSFWSTNTKYLKDGVHKRENHRIDCQKERVRFQLEKLWNFTIFDKKNIVKLKLCLRNQIFQFKNVYKFLTHKTISPCWNIIGFWSRFSRQIKTVNYVSEIRIEKKNLERISFQVKKLSDLDVLLLDWCSGLFIIFDKNLVKLSIVCQNFKTWKWKVFQLKKLWYVQVSVLSSHFTSLTVLLLLQL